MNVIESSVFLWLYSVIWIKVPFKITTTPNPSFFKEGSLFVHYFSAVSIRAADFAFNG